MNENKDCSKFRQQQKPSEVATPRAFAVLKYVDIMAYVVDVGYLLSHFKI
jgi:hypothetical protein